MLEHDEELAEPHDPWSAAGQFIRFTGMLDSMSAAEGFKKGLEQTGQLFVRN